MQCKLNSGHNRRVAAQVEEGAEKNPKHKRNVALEHGGWIKLKTQSLTQFLEAFWHQRLYSRDKEEDSGKWGGKKINCQEEIWSHLNGLFITILHKAWAVPG